MLTIGQLATHAGTTVRAVRHYHQIGLMPEPERDYSGYRRYDAAAVVRLIRIRTLAEAGVPLTQVQTLLEASPEDFAAGVEQIDKDLRKQIRRLQSTRKRLSTLAGGERMALPQSVVDYLDRLRGFGVDERYVALERDAWIMVAAQMPDQIEEIMVGKHRDLDDPDLVQLYSLLSQAMEWSADDPRVVEIADVLERVMSRALQAGEHANDSVPDQLADLIDAAAVESSPVAVRLMTILERRGWRGWMHVERESVDHQPGC